MRVKRIVPGLVALIAGMGLAVPRGVAAPRELVIAHENLTEAGEYLSANLDRLLRRIEQVAGWRSGSLKGKAFTRPNEALEYINKSHAGFAILPIHQVVAARRSLKLRLLGRAVGLEGTQLYHAGIARRPKGFTQLGANPAIKVAGPEVRDLTWLRIISDDNITPAKPAALIEVPSSQAALQSLLDKQADVAIVSHPMWQALEKRAAPGGDLEFVFASPRLPPSAVVAVGKYASAADQKKLGAALGQICKAPGGDACARMGVLYIQPGETQHHEQVLATYESMLGAP